jgi:hypothetical protein
MSTPCGGQGESLVPFHTHGSVYIYLSLSHTRTVSLSHTRLVELRPPRREGERETLPRVSAGTRLWPDAGTVSGQERLDKILATSVRPRGV